MHNAKVFFLSIFTLTVYVEAGILKNVLNSQHTARLVELEVDNLPGLSRSKVIYSCLSNVYKNDRVCNKLPRKYKESVSKILRGLHEINPDFTPILYKHLSIDNKTIKNRKTRATIEDHNNSTEIFQGKLGSYPKMLGLIALLAENVIKSDQYDVYGKKIHSEPLSVAEIDDSKINNEDVNKENGGNKNNTRVLVQNDNEAENITKTQTSKNLEHKRSIISTKCNNKSEGEEEEDSHELIFINSKDELEPQTEDTSEMSTDDFIHGPRFKREQYKANIIEEENIGTTVPAHTLTYTNRNIKLISDNYFKNINA